MSFTGEAQTIPVYWMVYSRNIAAFYCEDVIPGTIILLAFILVQIGSGLHIYRFAASSRYLKVLYKGLSLTLSHSNSHTNG